MSQKRHLLRTNSDKKDLDKMDTPYIDGDFIQSTALREKQVRNETKETTQRARETEAKTGKKQETENLRKSKILKTLQNLTFEIKKQAKVGSFDC
jgi:hypothetical protein